MNHQRDYETNGDYSPPSADWLDCTRAGATYQEQMDLLKYDHFRHRDASKLGAWIKGRAPK